eukprot:Gregarina_sp_Poly_1__10102@NODE_686_length_6765_cov_78_516124_g517_i0_p2_GENE_NODE_686_length_6765_cov_78_516124_g517_i0NODE_686_length_6765_cov_78_516124_g517_i0_p2_ORF_typecomplete_len400_score48_37zfCCCH/PF00642_24/2_6e06zfCCCH_4/PF18044_1/1_1e05zf_CCCH_4/PF18345_1/0_00011Torus/PF16131_5/0_006zfCCCH_3/PF15663_5/0_01zfCCCH_2/PF14608_6/0_083_NODE_686_length_6765_cov_78_516124_g517_i035214720
MSRECRFFLRGSCPFGSKCKDLHSQETSVGAAIAQAGFRPSTLTSNPFGSSMATFQTPAAGAPQSQGPGAWGTASGSAFDPATVPSVFGSSAGFGQSTFTANAPFGSSQSAFARPVVSGTPFGSNAPGSQSLASPPASAGLGNQSSPTEQQQFFRGNFATPSAASAVPFSHTPSVTFDQPTSTRAFNSPNPQSIFGTVPASFGQSNVFGPSLTAAAPFPTHVPSAPAQNTEDHNGTNLLNTRIEPEETLEVNKDFDMFTDQSSVSSPKPNELSIESMSQSVKSTSIAAPQKQDGANSESDLEPSIPVASKPVASLPVASKPVLSIPMASKPVGSIPVASKPIASKAAGSESGDLSNSMPNKLDATSTGQVEPSTTLPSEMDEPRTEKGSLRARGKNRSN